MPITKGQIVRYIAHDGRGLTVEAIVKRVHRDGSATVEARHFVSADGSRLGCYLGFTFRLAVEDLMEAA